MDNNSKDNPINEHYLQVQALTPVSGQELPPPETSSDSILPGSFNAVSTSVIIFFSMMVIGSLALLVTKARHINRLLALLLIAFTTSAIPLTLNTVSNQITYQSQAELSETPQQITITNISSTSFTVNWYTDKANVGSIRLGTTPEFTDYTRVIDQVNDVASNNHLVVVNDLVPNTTYYFTVLSGSVWYDQNGQPLTLSTL